MSPSRLALLTLLPLLAMPAWSAETRLFILSGQSNMANLKPEDSFTPTLTAAFPGDDLVVVKEAINGQQIRMWLPDWQAPAATAGEPAVNAAGKPVRLDGNGRLYKSLMDKVTTAMTGKPRPASVVFCWMQGEADARAGYGTVYEASLRTLFKHLEADLKRDDVGWVIGRISDYGNQLTDEEPDWNTIRAIQVAVATSTPHATWIDNDDLNGAHDGLHYPSDGYRTLGERFATAAVALIRPAAAPAK